MPLISEKKQDVFTVYCLILKYCFLKIMDLEYVDIMIGGKFFRLHIWTSFIGQFIDPVGGKGRGRGVMLF